jgi:hypothetical protein
MTKNEMLDFIETTGMVIDFDRKYLMRKSKTYIADLHEAAILYAQKNRLKKRARNKMMSILTSM